MPISAEKMKLYPGGSIRSKEWLAIRSERLLAAGNACEFCRAPNGEIICRGDDGTYMLGDGEVRDAETGERLGRARGSEYPGRYIKVVLTIAHLDHDVGNNEDDNLKALCQRCHLTWDAKHHAANARATRNLKVGQSDLFAPEAKP